MSWKFLASCDIVQLTLMGFAIIILIVRKKTKLNYLASIGENRARGIPKGE